MAYLSLPPKQFQGILNFLGAPKLHSHPKLGVYLCGIPCCGLVFCPEEVSPREEGVELVELAPSPRIVVVSQPDSRGYVVINFGHVLALTGN
jgi:hypothetical protein